MRTLSVILSLIIAFAFFAMFLQGFQTSVFIAAGAGLISFIGGMLMFSPAKKGKQKVKQTAARPAPKQNKKPIPRPDDEELVFEGMTRGEFRRIINDGRDQIKRIEEIGLKIMKHDVRVNILEICTTATDIFDDFVKDPQDIREARRFILYYLDTTERIVSKYYQLSGAPYLSEEAKKTLKNVEQTLDMIKDTFRKQLKKLTENDVLDLDAEVKVLQNTIKQEGI
jgi:5-bromo-4-chloroindolyl phosphate hydrolysis protein